MIDYKTAVFDVFACGTIPNGYTGERATVGFHFDKKSGKTVAVSACGLFNSGIPPAASKEEALWLLENHPIARNIIIDVVS